MSIRSVGRLGAVDPSAAAAIASAIQKAEGWFPGSVSYRNNNPGNLHYAGQPGAVAGPDGVATFSSYDAGYQALLRQMNLDASRGLTLAQYIYKATPPSENNTASYLSSIENATGFDGSMLLNDLMANGADGTAADGDLVDDSSSQVETSVAGEIAIGVALAAGIYLFASAVR